jgi:site-specific DNA-methyltransferase (adenine-specific)
LEDEEEKLGYDTQKPLGLLERIIKTSSDENSIVLDPFCGCGTAVAAAEKLKRRWVGIDITHLSIALMKQRLRDKYPLCQFKVIGEPKDTSSAQQLAHDDRYQFQWWALSLIPRALPYGGQLGSREGKKGSDTGIDGSIVFMEKGGKAERILIQVKSGHVNTAQIRDLLGTMQREKAPMGIFVTLEQPTNDMTIEAVKAGFYFSPANKINYQKLQIFTIDDLLKGARPHIPQKVGEFVRPKKLRGLLGEIRSILGEQVALDLTPRMKPPK